MKKIVLSICVAVMVMASVSSIAMAMEEKKTLLFKDGLSVEVRGDNSRLVVAIGELKKTGLVIGQIEKNISPSVAVDLNYTGEDGLSENLIRIDRLVKTGHVGFNAVVIKWERPDALKLMEMYVQKFLNF